MGLKIIMLLRVRFVCGFGVAMLVASVVLAEVSVEGLRAEVLVAVSVLVTFVTV